MEILKQKYEELLFLTETKQEDLAGLAIIYVHAINISKGLKSNGLLEDDPEEENIIPPNWNTPVQDVKVKDVKQSQQSQQYDKDFFWTPVNSNNNNNSNTTGNPFGNYGRSDLEPVPFRNDIFQPMNPLQIFSRDTGGNLMGPNNPIFNQPQSNNPHFRYDPIMPGSMGQGPDNDIFIPQNMNDPNFPRGNFRPQRGGFGGGFGNGNRHMFG